MAHEFDVASDVCIVITRVTDGLLISMFGAVREGPKIWEERGRYVYKFVFGDGER